MLLIAVTIKTIALVFGLMSFSIKKTTASAQTQTQLNNISSLQDAVLFIRQNRLIDISQRTRVMKKYGYDEVNSFTLLFRNDESQIIQELVVSEQVGQFRTGNIKGDCSARFIASAYSDEMYNVLFDTIDRRQFFFDLIPSMLFDRFEAMKLGLHFAFDNHQTVIVDQLTASTDASEEGCFDFFVNFVRTCRLLTPNEMGLAFGFLQNLKNYEFIVRYLNQDAMCVIPHPVEKSVAEIGEVLYNSRDLCGWYCRHPELVELLGRTIKSIEQYIQPFAQEWDRRTTSPIKTFRFEQIRLGLHFLQTMYDLIESASPGPFIADSTFSLDFFHNSVTVDFTLGPPHSHIYAILLVESENTAELLAKYTTSWSEEQLEDMQDLNLNLLFEFQKAKFSQRIFFHKFQELVLQFMNGVSADASSLLGIKLVFVLFYLNLDFDWDKHNYESCRLKYNQLIDRLVAENSPFFRKDLHQTMLSMKVIK